MEFRKIHKGCKHEFKNKSLTRHLLFLAKGHTVHGSIEPMAVQNFETFTWERTANGQSGDRCIIKPTWSIHEVSIHTGNQIIQFKPTMITQIHSKQRKA